MNAMAYLHVAARYTFSAMNRADFTFMFSGLGQSHAPLTSRTMKQRLVFEQQTCQAGDYLPSTSLRLQLVWLSAVMMCGAALVAGSELCLGEDWPQWLGPNRNGISKESKFKSKWPATGPKLLWSQEVGTGFSGNSTLLGALISLDRVNGSIGSGNSTIKYSSPIVNQAIASVPYLRKKGTYRRLFN